MRLRLWPLPQPAARYENSEVQISGADENSLWKPLLRRKAA
jgi:hypothetical protein